MSRRRQNARSSRRIRGGSVLFSPASIATLKLWLIASAGVTTVGGHVTAWADQSGGGNNCTSAGLITVGTGAAGLPCLTFPGGVNDLLDGTLPFVAATDITMFVVGRISADSQALFAGTVGGSANSGFAVFRSGGSVFARCTNGGAGDCTSAALGNVAAVYGMRTKVSTENFLILNGTSTGAQVPGAGAPVACNEYEVGSLGSTSTLPLIGEIEEILLYGSELSVAQYNQVDRYLGSKYGITVA